MNTSYKAIGLILFFLTVSYARGKFYFLFNSSFIFNSILLIRSFSIAVSYYVPQIKFSKPCEHNTIDPSKYSPFKMLNIRYWSKILNFCLILVTGNFKCMVRTGAECFELCQQHGCFEWSFTSFMASTDSRIHDHYRCRCVQNICLYNYVRERDRDYTWSDQVGIRRNSGFSRIWSGGTTKSSAVVRRRRIFPSLVRLSLHFIQEWICRQWASTADWLQNKSSGRSNSFQSVLRENKNKQTVWLTDIVSQYITKSLRLP